MLFMHRVAVHLYNILTYQKKNIYIYMTLTFCDWLFHLFIFPNKFKAVMMVIIQYFL